MKKTAFILILSFVLCMPVSGQDQIKKTKRGNVPVSLMFHNFGWNTLHSFSHNYGMNFIGAGLGTLIFIESGLDWKWNRLAYNNSWMSKVGAGANYVGYVVPALTPAVLYFTGVGVKNEKLQITGLALSQSLMLTMLFQVPLKMATGRTWPGIADGWDSSKSRRSGRTDDYSGEFNWFNFDSVGGWPSGHTANAFSAAATMAQLYPDNTWLKAGLYSYASLIGISMSVYDHWASDVIAGALIGLAVGTVVGKSYRSLMEGKENKMAFYVTNDSIGVIIKIQ